MKKIIFVISLLTIRLSWAAPIDDYALVLAKVAKPKGVDWGQFSSIEKTKLAHYLDSIAPMNSAGTKNDKNELLAFWLNAHNACVMRVISEHLPIEDVMKISGFRDKITCKIDGQDRTIIEIQSSVIRPLFQDPRVHFAMWWGTKGGPRLLNVPYEAKKLTSQLIDQINDSIVNRHFVDFSQKPTHLSPIFDWFRRDFGADKNAPIGFIRNVLPKDKVAKLPQKMEDVKFSTFDWTLDRAQTN